MYGQSQRISEESAPAHSKLQELLRDLEEIERFLADATLETTTPEAFATATARQILLKRAVEKAGLASNTAAAEMDSAQSNFRNEYANYERTVRLFLSGRNDWGHLLLAVERDQLLQQIEDWIGV
jgi:hypothetical protein